jgi:hypothetical protein
LAAILYLSVPEPHSWQIDSAQTVSEDDDDPNKPSIPGFIANTDINHHNLRTTAKRQARHAEARLPEFCGIWTRADSASSKTSYSQCKADAVLRESINYFPAEYDYRVGGSRSEQYRHMSHYSVYNPSADRRQGKNLDCYPHVQLERQVYGDGRRRIFRRQRNERQSTGCSRLCCGRNGYRAFHGRRRDFASWSEISIHLR